MTYNEAIDYIYSRRKFAKDGSHTRIKNLLNLMNNPHQNLKFIHVVGTNGKGSTSTFAAKILKTAGYKVGLFTSPFVIEFGERIQVNGEFMEKNSVIEIIEQIKNHINQMKNEDLQPNVFEVTTVLAFTYFAKMNCDIVVLEAGIGGEHDSTNVISPPLVSIFTSISLDHTYLLGETVEQIAKEKAGIIKKGSAVVSYTDENQGFDFLPQQAQVINIIKKRCGKLSCDFSKPNISSLKINSMDIFGTHFEYDNLNLHTTLMGQHQVANAITAITAIKALIKKGYNITNENITQGIANAKIVGRMQVLQTNPLIIADGGHNEGCMKELSSTIKKHLSNKSITMLMTFVKGKDFESSMKIILPRCTNLILTPLADGSNEDIEILENAAKKYCNNVITANDSETAMKTAKSLNNDAIIVAGSFYLVSEIV